MPQAYPLFFLFSPEDLLLCRCPPELGTRREDERFNEINMSKSLIYVKI